MLSWAAGKGEAGLQRSLRIETGRKELRSECFLRVSMWRFPVWEREGMEQRGAEITMSSRDRFLQVYTDTSSYFLSISLSSVTFFGAFASPTTSTRSMSQGAAGLFVVLYP